MSYLSMKNIADSKKAIEWTIEYLANNGYLLHGPTEPVRIMPWSKVHRVLTHEGYVYLKQMSPPFAIEAKLVKYLSRQFGASIPNVIAINNALDCFLMADAGNPLRNLLKKKYPINLIGKALDSYATFQYEAVRHVDDLLSLGVPDWRLAKLPHLYQDLISKRELLEIEGLELSEIDKLQNLHSNFTDLCNLLSNYKIPETIEHGDFHDNNILIKDYHLTINDWGDAVISQPFFSLISLLESASRNHKLTEKSDTYNELQATYLNKWLEYETKENVLKAFELAKRLWPIKFALSFYRITLCAGMSTLVQYKGTIAQALQTFVQAERSYCG